MGRKGYDFRGSTHLPRSSYKTDNSVIAWHPRRLSSSVLSGVPLLVKRKNALVRPVTWSMRVLYCLSTGWRGVSLFLLAGTLAAFGVSSLHAPGKGYVSRILPCSVRFSDYDTGYHKRGQK